MNNIKKKNPFKNDVVPRHIFPLFYIIKMWKNDDEIEDFFHLSVA